MNKRVLLEFVRVHLSEVPQFLVRNGPTHQDQDGRTFNIGDVGGDLFIDFYAGNILPDMSNWPVVLYSIKLDAQGTAKTVPEGTVTYKSAVAAVERKYRVVERQIWSETNFVITGPDVDDVLELLDMLRRGEVKSTPYRREMGLLRPAPWPTCPLCRLRAVIQRAWLRLRQATQNIGTDVGVT